MNFHTCSSKITKNKDIGSLSEIYSATALITCVRIYSHYSTQLTTLYVQTVIAKFSDNVRNGKAVPLQARTDPEFSRKLCFPDFKTTAQDSGKVVSLTYRPPLPPGNTPGTHFCYRLSRLQGHSAIGRILCQWNIPMTPVGIEPATFRSVAQHLNHCATAVPWVIMWIYNFHESGGYREAKISNPFYVEFIETQWHWDSCCPCQYHPTTAKCSFTYHKFHVNFGDYDVVKI